ncbi:MAG: L-threonylcarbamoyladenylate synthase [Flavobacteriales bacterium]
MDSSENDINKGLEVLRNGGVILYPTETIWGIGCDATNEKAVQRIMELKPREDREGFIILLDQDFKLNHYVRDVPDIAWDMIETDPQPLTIVYPEGMNVAPQVLSEDGSIAIRITSHILCKKLIKQLKKPIISTSANLPGEEPPLYYEEIDSGLKEKVDFSIMDEEGGLKESKPSSIVKLGSKGEVEVLRD